MIQHKGITFKLSGKIVQRFKLDPKKTTSVSFKQLIKYVKAEFKLHGGTLYNAMSDESKVSSQDLKALKKMMNTYRDQNKNGHVTDNVSWSVAK